MSVVIHFNILNLCNLSSRVLNFKTIIVAHTKIFRSRALVSRALSACELRLPWALSPSISIRRVPPAWNQIVRNKPVYIPIKPPKPFKRRHIADNFENIYFRYFQQDMVLSFKFSKYWNLSITVKPVVHYYIDQIFFFNNLLSSYR